MVFSEGWNATYHGIATVAGFTQKMGTEFLKRTGVIQNQQTLELPKELRNLKVSNLVQTGSPIVCIAAVSGALAVVLGAYGAHTLYLKEDFKEREEVFHVANRYHFFHTLALLGTPMCRFPRVTAIFMTLGMLLFCGTCYYEAVTYRKTLRKLTPIGGICFIVGWLCMML